MPRRLARSARALSVLAIAAASAVTHAQTLPSPPPSTQPAIVPATGPATLPATQAAIAPATAPAGTRPSTTQPVSIVGTPASHPAQNISLEFKDVPIDTVLDYLSEQAGFIVSKESPLEGRVSITSRGKVSAAEALTLLNAALNKPNGYSAIRSGRILRVGKRSDFKKEDIPVQSGNDPEAVPETYDLVTWVIPLKNVDAAKLRTDLQPLISSDADFTANAGSNSLILTDTCANIKRIVSIVSKLDQQQALASDILIKQLTFASASAAAKLITSIFAPDAADNAQGGPGGRGGRFIRAMMQNMGGPGGPGGPGGGAGGQDSGKTSGKVTAAADDRTNTIIVVGPVSTLSLISKILEQLDNDKTPGTEVKVFQMEFADAASAAKLINSIFQQDQTGGGGGQRGGGDGGPPGGRMQNFEGLTPSDRNVKVNAAAADHTNTLVVTAPPDTLKYISNILEQLDKDPAAMSEVKVFQLKYADSASAAKLISSVFLTDPSQQQQQGGGGPGGPQQQHLPAIGNLSTSLHGGRVNAVSDDRTNTLVVTAPKDAMTIVTGILEKLDSNPSAESALFIYHLRNGIAQDIQATLSSLFSSGSTGGSAAPNNGRSSGQSLLNSGLGSSQGFGGGGVGGSGGRSGLGGSSGGFGGNSGSSSFGQPLSSSGSQRSSGTTAGGAAGGANIRATSELVGQVIVVADVDTNSLLVSTASRYREQVKKIIEELDRPIPQVLIKVLVVEVTHERSNDLGIDFSILDQRASGKGLTVAQGNGNIAAAAQTPSGLVVGLMETQLNATLHALAVDNKLDVLSRPYILASDNQPASITIGQEVPFITDTQITQTGQQINTITYQAVGIILNVTPHINPDGAVTLDVAPEISAISAQTVPIGNGISAPVIDNRSAQSRVTIRNGNTIVIGGMMQDQKTVTQTKIPLLGDIPWLGALFTRYQTDRSKTELLIFLTPHIAPQPDALDGMSKDEMKTTNITETAVEPGEFKKHFDNMQRGNNPTPATTQSTSVDFNPPPSTQPFHGDIIAPAPGNNRNRPGMGPGK